MLLVKLETVCLKPPALRLSVNIYPTKGSICHKPYLLSLDALLCKNSQFQTCPKICIFKIIFVLYSFNLFRIQVKDQWSINLRLLLYQYYFLCLDGFVKDRQLFLFLFHHAYSFSLNFRLVASIFRSLWKTITKL